MIVAPLPPDRQMSNSKTKKNVIIFQSLLPHYRVGIFELVAKSELFNYLFCFCKNIDSHFLKVMSENPPFPAVWKPFHSVTLGGHRFYFQGEQIVAALGRKYDVIIYQGDFHILSYMLGTILARLRGKKVIHWTHGVPTKGPDHGFKLWMRKAILGLANAVLLYGQREYDYYKSIGLAMDKFFMTHNALDTRQSKAIMAAISSRELQDFQQRRNLAGRKVLIYTGRVLKNKRLNLAIEAMPAIAKAEPIVKFVIVGDGPELPAIKQQAKDLNVTDWVDFPGAIYEEEELAKYFLSSLLAISPGPLGLMVNHAFVYGVPVITNDDLWTHMPEIAMVRPGETGLFFKDGDSNSLAQCVLSLLNDEHKLNEMRSSCRRLIDELYNERHMAGSFDEVVTYALAH